jgi:predicted RNA polymerase sigma factor
VTAGASVEDLLRRAAPDVIAALVRRHGDFDRCEDAVQEALLAAALQWPESGVPANPTGWLVRVASRRRIELWRNDAARRRREKTAVRLAPAGPEPAEAADDSGDVDAARGAYREAARRTLSLPERRGHPPRLTGRWDLDPGQTDLDG